VEEEVVVVVVVVVAVGTGFEGEDLSNTAAAASSVAHRVEASEVEELAHKGKGKVGSDKGSGSGSE